MKSPDTHENAPSTSPAPPQPTEAPSFDAEVARRARWVENGQSSWILKACCKDGSAVLANVRFVLYIGYVWHAAGRGGYAGTVNGSKRAARQALREGHDHA